MTWRIPRALAAGLIPCLMGCSDNTPAPLASASPAFPPVTTVNGTYNGLMQLVVGSAVGCGTSDEITLVVRDNVFRYVLKQPQVPWQPQRTFVTTISPDGSFRAGTDVSYITGTVSRGHMQGQIVGDACQFQFEADSDGSF